MSGTSEDRRPTPLPLQYSAGALLLAAFVVVPILTYWAAETANAAGIRGEWGGFDGEFGVIIALVAALPSGYVLTLTAMFANETRFARPRWVISFAVVYSVCMAVWLASGTDWCK